MGITAIPDLLTTVSVSTKSERPKVLTEVADYEKYYRHADSTFISYPLVAEKPLDLENKPLDRVSAGSKKLGDIALTGRYFRHPDSALISYPLVVEKPLGSINKPLNIAIIGAGAAGIAALYELSNLHNSSKYIHVTIYESDTDNFIHHRDHSLTRRGLKAGRVYSAKSSDQSGGTDHTVYEIGAMRFPEIAGLMWHYARILYGDEKTVNLFPNPGTVPTEIIHGDRVDRFGNGKWLDPNSPTKQVVDVIRSRLFGSEDGPDTSLFPIGGQDPAKISKQLKDPKTTKKQLAHIYEQWKNFAKMNDERTVESAVREVIQKSIDELPKVDGLRYNTEKINHYLELFGTVGFGTGGFKGFYNVSLLELIRTLIWDFSTEYFLPTEANVYFIRDLYLKALRNNSNVKSKLARVCDVGHLDGNSEGDTLIVSYAISPDNGEENSEPEVGIYDYVILTSMPGQASSMISRIGFNNKGYRPTLGDYDRPLNPEDYKGEVRPALILSNRFNTPNSEIYVALNNIHLVSSTKIFAKVEKSEFDSYAPEFLDQGKIRAVLSDCGLGASYVIPFKNFYNFLISYSWENVAKKLQHTFTVNHVNTNDTKEMIKSLINCTHRNIRDPENGNALGRWWFGKVLSQSKLEELLSFDWTLQSAGAFKLDSAGGHFSSDLLFRYHTHALKPDLKNKFFLANDSYSHMGGWLEGAFMSAVNAVSGLIVAANGGDVNALSEEARKVMESFDSVVKDDQ